MKGSNVARVRELPKARYKELVDKFRQHIRALPGGEAMDECIQCGTCSGSCPTGWAMDYSPREIIAALRAGNLEIILEGNTMWMCTSCYTCTVRCPQQIRVTDLMYELKRLAVKYNLHEPGLEQVTIAKTFVEMIENHGRNSEPTFMMQYYMRTNPFKLLTKGMGLAMKFWSKGRLRPMETFFPRSIKGVNDIKTIFAKLEGSELGNEPVSKAKEVEA